MGNTWRSYRAMRGELPRLETWEAVDLGPRGEGGFLCGRVEGRYSPLYWFPRHGGRPHGLIAGQTRQGKSEVMKWWAMVPILQSLYHGIDWQPPIILDPKGGAMFEVAVQNGARLKTRITDIRSMLHTLNDHADERNRLMGQHVVQRVGRDGVSRPFKATKVYDYTQAERAELDMVPVVVLVDELRDLLGEGWEGITKEERAILANVRKDFISLAQKAGSAGIHIVGAVQQPRADILGSFARDQLGARLLVGRPDNAQTLTMVMGEIEGKRVAQEAEVLTPGHGFAVGVSARKSVERVYLPLVDLTLYGSLGEPRGVQGPRRLHTLREMRRKTHPGDLSLRRREVPGSLRGAVAWAVVGPAMRVWLMLGALRWLGVALEEGPFERSEAVRVETWALSDGTCAACGRGGQMEVDHARPMFAGGVDETENTRLLCIRPGRASCHRAKTRGETFVRSLRIRTGTARGPAQRPLHESVTTLVRARRAWWYGLWASLLVGVVWHPMLVVGIAGLVFLVLGPVIAIVQAKASRKDHRASPDGAVDPKARRSPAIEYLKAKGGRTFRDRFTRKHHDRLSSAAFGRHYTLRATGLYLLGWSSWWIVPALPGVALALLGLLVS